MRAERGNVVEMARRHERGGATMKQPYTTPQLIVHGNVERITQGSCSNGNKDTNKVGHAGVVVRGSVVCNI